MAQKIFSCEMCNIDFSARKYLFIHKNHSHKYDENLVYGVIKVEMVFHILINKTYVIFSYHKTPNGLKTRP